MLLLALLLVPSVSQLSDHGHSFSISDGDATRWAEAPAELLQHLAALERPCTIRREHGHLPSSLEDVTEPLLVRPSTTAWPPDVQAWSDRAGFLQRHGAVSVEPHSSLATAQGGARRTATTVGTRTLRSVLDGWQNGERDSHRQIFEGAAQGQTQPVPPKLHEDSGQQDDEACDSGSKRNCTVGNGWIDAMREELGPMCKWLGASDSDLIFSLGQSGAGLPRPSHGAAWLASIVGSKFWILHPPVGEGGSPDWPALPLSTAQWLQQLASPTYNEIDSRARAQTREQPQWCLQQPGEVMLLPAFWHHATLNIGETMAVGGQQNVFRWSEPLEALEELMQKSDTGSNARLLELTADSMLQLSTEAEREGAAAATGRDTRGPAAALSLLIEASSLEPLNTRLHLKVARLAASQALGQTGVAWKYLQAAMSTLRELEERRTITGADAAEVGGQIGVALMMLAKDHSESHAVPLLTRAVEADRL
eukprot:COSAG02_NODE_9028_length_2356_cov_2.214001_2_plen_478_part_01